MIPNEPQHRSAAYHAGLKAGEEGEPREANPYPAGTPESDEWLAGWNAASPAT